MDKKNLKKIKMNKKQLANKLNGREYPFRLSKEEIQIAKDNRLVVVYGTLDDFIKFEGVINDELYCYDGGTAQLNKNGLLEFHRDEKTCNNCKYFNAYMENIKYIKALWYDGEYIWSYETSIPHTTFDIIEDGRKYCRGIIFNINNLKK